MSDAATPGSAFRSSEARDANTSSATHTTPAVWTLLGSTADGPEMRSSVYTRTAPASFGGSLATFTADVADVPAGSVVALNATSSLASAKAIAWTIVVTHA